MKSLTSKALVAVALAAAFAATQAVHAAGWPSTPGTICPPYSGSTSYVVPSYTTPVSSSPAYYNSGGYNTGGYGSGGYYGGTPQPVYNSGYGPTAPVGNTILPGGCYNGNCYPATIPSNGSYYPDPYAVPTTPYNVNYNPLPNTYPVDPRYDYSGYGGSGYGGSGYGYGYDMSLDHLDDYRYRTNAPAVRETWPVDYTRPAYDGYNNVAPVGGYGNVWPANGYAAPRPELIPAYGPDYRYQTPVYRGTSTTPLSSSGGAPFYP